MKCRTQCAWGAARANSSAGTESIAPRIIVNIRRGSPGSDDFQRAPTRSPTAPRKRRGT
jgi:hypothetical protein